MQDTKKVDHCWCGGEVEHVSADDEMMAIACAESEFHNPFADGRPTKIETLYIAGPCSGYPANNYPAFNEAEELLVAAGWAVINPTKSHPQKRHHYVDLLREDLKHMLDCHGVAVLDYWWESVGARNEVAVAGLLKMPVRTVDDWLYFARK